VAGLFQITQKVFLLRDRGEGEELLVLRDRATGEGDLPGGRLDEGELHGDWRSAIARELREELGPDVRCRLDPEPAFWFKHRIRASGRDALGFAWSATWIGGEVVLSDEHDLMAWVAVASFDPTTWFSGHLLAAVRTWQAGAHALTDRTD
jgi:8-oxo-dGTP pyrophosphatase MutT (NUDIX family)